MTVLSASYTKSYHDQFENKRYVSSWVSLLDIDIS